MQVDVHLIDAAFQNSGVATSLRDALEQLDGPIRHLATTRFQSRTLWSDAIKGCSHPGLIELLQAPAGMGLLKRLTRQTPSAAVQLCRRAEAVLQRLPAQSDPQRDAEAAALADCLGDALARLPEHLRVPVVLRYYSGLPEKDIAVAIQRRPGTVKSRLAEARRRLSEDPSLAEWAGLEVAR